MKRTGMVLLAGLAAGLAGRADAQPAARTEDGARSAGHAAVGTPPAVQVAPEALGLSLGAGQFLELPLTIANAGGADLQFSISETAKSPAPIHTLPARHIPGAGPRPDSTVQIQQTESLDIEVNNIPGCYGQNVHSTSWWRRFHFSDHGISGPVRIEEVAVGVETAQEVPVTINVYRVPWNSPMLTISLGDLELIGTGTGTFDGNMYIETVPIEGGLMLDTANYDLVVEYHIEESPAMLRAGGNRSPETRPTYMYAPACNITQPQRMSYLGFPDAHLVMTVTVSTVPEPIACSFPSDVPWLDLSQTQGSVAPGDVQDITVRADAAGMAAGDSHSALLCVTTNDPARPLVAVPVTLDVMECVDDRIFADSFEGEPPAGSCDSRDVPVPRH